MHTIVTDTQNIVKGWYENATATHDTMPNGMPMFCIFKDGNLVLKITANGFADREIRTYEVATLPEGIDHGVEYVP